MLRVKDGGIICMYKLYNGVDSEVMDKLIKEDKIEKSYEEECWVRVKYFSFNSKGETYDYIFYGL